MKTQLRIKLRARLIEIAKKYGLEVSNIEDNMFYYLKIRKSVDLKDENSHLLNMVILHGDNIRNDKDLDEEMKRFEERVFLMIEKYNKKLEELENEKK